ncbi:MAG TPA: hypothetical protein ENK02_06485 [Planctomycetes bacterium]|nr:hypothetical protein [Planctomycetota bacterium]
MQGSPLTKSVHPLIGGLLWTLLFLLAPLRACLGPGTPEGQALEFGFLARHLGALPDFGRVWFQVFPRLGGFSLGVFVAWGLISLSLGVLVLPFFGPFGTALTLLFLAAMPLVGGLGALGLPWLPAAALVLVTGAFLASYARSSKSRPMTAMLAFLGAVFATGMAGVTAPEALRVLLVSGGLFLLSMLLCFAKLLQLRRGGERGDPLVLLGRLVTRRALPWALVWFFSMAALVTLDRQMGVPDFAFARGATGLYRAEGVERGLAYAAIPGLLLLLSLEGRSLARRLILMPSTVALVFFVVLFTFGPGLHPAPGPLWRLVSAPAVAVGLAAIPWMLQQILRAPRGPET